MHSYGEDWPLLVVVILSPIPGVVRCMLVGSEHQAPLGDEEVCHSPVFSVVRHF